jgi:uncharacterized protein YbjT (DUF2867 family)
MNVVIFGATGMVGSGVLLECLEDARIASVLVVGRNSVGITAPKLREILIASFADLGPIQSEFTTCDACSFCLGVSSAGMSEERYRRVTYDLTLEVAKAMVAANPAMTFCYVSGAGTDSTGQGSRMWARVKGQTENALLRLPFKAAYMFRPAFIVPLKGVRSKTPIYQAMYNVLAPLYPLLRRLAPRFMTTTVNVGRAMIAVALNGYDRPIIESPEIEQLARERAR